MYVWGLNMETIFFLNRLLGLPCQKIHQMITNYIPIQEEYDEWLFFGNIQHFFFNPIFILSKLFLIDFVHPKEDLKKSRLLHLFKIDKGGDRHISFLKPLISTWKDNDLYAEKRAGKKYILLANASTSQYLFWKAILEHIEMCF